MMMVGAVSAATFKVDTKPVENKNIKVLTTFTILADMAKNVAGDKLEVVSITKPGAEIHHYEPTPNDIVRAQSAQLILDNGLNLEAWAERFYSNLPGVPHVTLSEGVPLSIIEAGSFAGKPNPHAWMSPKNALIYVENIRKAFTDIDPKNANVYAENAKKYSEEISGVDSFMKTELAKLPEDKRILTTCEGAFTYLTRDYDLGELYLWAINSDQEATPQQMKLVIDQISEKKIPAVFCESTVNNKAQIAVAKQTGAKDGGVLYVDSLTAEDGAAPTYLQLLKVNANTIVSGLIGGMENDKNN